MALASEDFVAIHQLYARQSQAIDLGDAVGWADTFTPEGTFRSPTYASTVTGRAELTAFAQRFAETAAEQGRAYRHWMNAIVLEPTAQDGVAATGYLAIVVLAPQQPPQFDRHVEFADALERTPDGWRCASRVVTRRDV